jgi:hypothetical protein
MAKAIKPAVLERECGHCRGTGRIVLAGKYRETWDLLAAQGESNPAALAIHAGCTMEAMANRLKMLLDHGFVVRVRSKGDHKRWYYRVAIPPEPTQMKTRSNQGTTEITNDRRDNSKRP